MSSRLSGTRSGQKSTHESRRLSHGAALPLRWNPWARTTPAFSTNSRARPAPFAAAAPIRNQEALDRIVQWACAGPADTVLDVACGPGLLACAFARVAKHATGIDMTPAMLEQARKTQHEQGLKNVSWEQGDVYALPFPARSFLS